MGSPTGTDRTTGTRRDRNPFHPILLAAGVAFVMAACSYSVLYIKQLTAEAEASLLVIEQHPWLALLDRHGEMLLAAALAILAVAALADFLWECERRGNAQAVIEPDQIQDDSGEP
jgi:hypothetical protein